MRPGESLAAQNTWRFLRPSLLDAPLEYWTFLPSTTRWAFKEMLWQC